MPNSIIISDPKIMFGKPVVAGTRVTVELILDRLAAGESEDGLIADFPHLSKEAIRAALAFASRAIRFDVVFPGEETSG